MSNDNNTHYALIEKNLMSGGFNVRDRGLLSLLLESGITDYSEIAKKNNADVIIEIISMTFPVTTGNRVTTDSETPDNYYDNYWANNIKIANACVEFKLHTLYNCQLMTDNCYSLW